MGCGAADAAGAGEAVAAAAPLSLLDQIVIDGRLGQSDEEKAIGKSWVEKFVAEVMNKTIKISADEPQVMS